jgi:hypothetical protein
MCCLWAVLIQVLFSPLLAAMGLETVRMSALMKELGGSLSLRGCLSCVRVKIIDSEFHDVRNVTMPRAKVSYFTVVMAIFILHAQSNCVMINSYVDGAKIVFLYG